MNVFPDLVESLYHAVTWRAMRRMAETAAATEQRRTSVRLSARHLVCSEALPTAPDHLGHRAQFRHQVHEVLVIERLAAIRFGPIGIGMHFDDHAIGP